MQKIVCKFCEDFFWQYYFYNYTIIRGNCQNSVQKGLVFFLVFKKNVYDDNYKVIVVKSIFLVSTKKLLRKQLV